MKAFARLVVAGLGVAASFGGLRAAAGSAPANSVYRFEQSVVRVDRDDPSAPGTTEEYQRQGFLVADFGTDPAAPLALTEFVLPATATGGTNSREWTRTELLGLDAEQRALHTLEWGWPSSSTEVLFDSVTREPSVVGAPVPFSAFFLPGVIAPNTDAKMTDGERTVTIAWSAGIFPLRFRISPDSEHPGWTKVVLSADPVVFQGRRQLLVLRADGGWRMKSSSAARLPVESVGKLSLRLLTRSGAGGKAVENEVSSVKLEFRYVLRPTARCTAEKLILGGERPADG